MLGRDLNKTIIVDNSPVSYQLQPENALPIKSWFDDKEDRELLKIISVLREFILADDVRSVIPKFVRDGKIVYKEDSTTNVFEMPQNSINIDPTEIDFSLKKQSVNDKRFLNPSKFPKLFAQGRKCNGMRRKSDLYRLSKPSAIKVSLFSNGVLSSAPVTNCRQSILYDRMVTPRNNKKKSVWDLSGGKNFDKTHKNGNNLASLISSMGTLKDDKMSSMDSDKMVATRTYTSERRNNKCKHIFIKLVRE